MSVEKQTVDKTRTTRKTNSAQRFFTGINTFVYRLSGGKIQFSTFLVCLAYSCL